MYNREYTFALASGLGTRARWRGLLGKQETTTGGGGGGGGKQVLDI